MSQSVAERLLTLMSEARDECAWQRAGSGSRASPDLARMRIAPRAGLWERCPGSVARITHLGDWIAMSTIREQMVEVARLIYSRFLSDSAGGNISVREGDRIYISPRYMGSRYRYTITPAQITVMDSDHNILDGPLDLSRESRMHLAIYDAFEEVGSVIHAHPRWLMVYAAAGRTMKPVLEYTAKFGDVECIPEAPAHSQVLADGVVAVARRRREQLKRVAMGVLLPRHGVAVLGHDLDNAYDTLERLEDNARCSLLARLLPPED